MREMVSVTSSIFQVVLVLLFEVEGEKSFPSDILLKTEETTEELRVRLPVVVLSKWIII